MRFSIVVLEQVPAIFGLIERNGWKYLILVKSESSFSSEDDFCKVPWPLVYVIVPDVQDGIFVSQFMSDNLSCRLKNELVTPKVVPWGCKFL
ncbi:hypothetical protein MTR67_049541 [Solanum verrucosum]|uniref:Uncharacterized protein n=1 Tax=Solanum verrucosum TaxID=315347 RepID=A0AAF0V3M1_SOLVR|nr:hypothetical protein MTR67_049541 [Solanum verrucosum]